MLAGHFCKGFMIRFSVHANEIQCKELLSAFIGTAYPLNPRFLWFRYCPIDVIIE
jgi:hypothetical protein